jgi:HK97 family phage major capsid protein
MKTIKELREAIQKHLKDARDICDLAEKAERDFTAEERQKVAAYLDEAKKAKAELKTLQDDETMRNSILTLGEGIEIGGMNGKAAGMGQRILTLGDRFIKSADWQAWMKAMAPSGTIPESRKGLSSPSVNVGDLFGRKALVTGDSATSAGAFVESERTGIYEPLGRYPLVLRDLVSQRDTGSDTVEFVRQTAQVTQAAPTAESNVTDYTGATGQVSGEKPEGGMTFERVSETVKTVAVWIPATKRALSDAAQLRGLIDQELNEDLDEELENQMLNGNGLGENFTGLANTSGVLVQPWVTDLVVTTRKAKTNLLKNGKTRPTAWVFNPSDWETIELLKDGQNRYYWGGPMVEGQKTLWGIPVVESFFQAEGTAFLGNWRKAVLWNRQQNTISVTDSHADFFIRNMVAILAEMRAAWGIVRPSAFVEVDLTSGS